MSELTRQLQSLTEVEYAEVVEVATPLELALFDSARFGGVNLYVSELAPAFDANLFAATKALLTKAESEK